MGKLTWTVGIKPFIGATTYYTDYVLSLSYMDGRTSYLDQFTGNSIRITLKNQTNVAQYFTFGAVVIVNDAKQFKITGVQFDDYPGNTGLSTCTVIASDYLQNSGREVLSQTPLTAASDFNQLRDQVYLGNSEAIVASTGGSSVAKAYLYTGTLLQRLQQTVTLEGSGALQYSQRTILLAGRSVDPGVYYRTTFSRATSAGSNVSYQDFRRIRADLQYANKITVKSDSDPSYTATASGLLPYGVSADSVSIVDVNQADREGLASWLANSRNDPNMQTFEIDVVDTAQASGALTALSNLWNSDTAQSKIHDLTYRVPGAASDTTETVYLEGIQVNVTPEQTRFTFFFSPLTLYNFFLLDNSTLGILDSSRLAW